MILTWNRHVHNKSQSLTINSPFTTSQRIANRIYIRFLCEFSTIKMYHGFKVQGVYKRYYYIIGSTYPIVPHPFGYDTHPLTIVVHWVRYPLFDCSTQWLSYPFIWQWFYIHLWIGKSFLAQVICIKMLKFNSPS